MYNDEIFLDQDRDREGKRGWFSVVWDEATGKQVYRSPYVKTADEAERLMLRFRHTHTQDEPSHNSKIGWMGTSGTDMEEHDY